MMKRIWILTIALALLGSTSMWASMSTTQISENARFLSDKMGYELGLSNSQYEDVYEINYNFIYSIQNYINGYVMGNTWASNNYYNELDIRNDDLRWVLTDTQYRRFLQTDYFYRPIYISGTSWTFSVYVNYPNRNLFYMGAPAHYSSYRGAHIRPTFSSTSYYRSRYTSSEHYQGAYLFRPVNARATNTYVNARPSTYINTRPSVNTRPSTTPARQGVTTRPTTNTRPAATNSRPNSTTSRPSTTTSRPHTTTSRPNATTSRPNSSTSRTNSTNARSTSSSRREQTTATNRAGSSPSSRSNSRSH